MLPNSSQNDFEEVINQLLKPILEAKRNNHIVRDFINKDEQIEIFESTYNDLIDELSRSEEIEDKYNLGLIYYIYDLLEYDKVILIDNEKFLYSCIYLNTYFETHKKAYEQLAISYKSKPAEKNIDIATNRMTPHSEKVKFIHAMYQPALNNQFVDNKAEKLKLGFLENYGNEYRMIARSIHQFSTLEDYVDNFEIKTIASLAPYINSDDHITNKDIYISWYAHVYTIYTHPKISTAQKLKLAQLSSYVIFPKLRDKKKPLINEKTALKPIREMGIFKGLRLLDFSDNRTKINKTDGEIDFTEEFLIKVTNTLNNLL